MSTPEEMRKQFEKEESWKLQQIVDGKQGWSDEHQIARDVLKKREDRTKFWYYGFPAWLALLLSSVAIGLTIWKL